MCKIISRAACVAVVLFVTAIISSSAWPIPLAALTAIGAPNGIVADREGNVYFSSQSIVYRLGADGSLRRVAGDGTVGYSGDGGPAVDAQLAIPESSIYLPQPPYYFGSLMGGLAVDSAGDLYIADGFNNRIRKVDANGIITTVLGEPRAGGIAAAVGLLPFPQGIAFDASDNMYISVILGTLLKISKAGRVDVLATFQSGKEGIPGLSRPAQIAAAGDGVVYVADGWCRVRRVDPQGVRTVAGQDDSDSCGYAGDHGPATLANIGFGASGVALDGKGTLYIADTGNHCIRRVAASGTIDTVAGQCGYPGFSGDGGPAALGLLTWPRGVAVDAAGNLYIADTGNYRLRKVRLDGTITTVAGNGEYRVGTALAPAVAIGPWATGSWLGYGPQSEDSSSSANDFTLALEVLPGEPPRLLVSLLTYGPYPFGGFVWALGIGPIDGAQAVVQAYRVVGSGARFPPNFDPAGVQEEFWGTLTLRFSDCYHGHVDWATTAPGYGDRGSSFHRVTIPAGVACP